jgi:hypothetical protein
MSAGEGSWSRAGVDDHALDALTRTLAPSRLWSLLLHVMARRAAQRTPAMLMDQWARDGFTAPAYVDQRTLTALDGLLLETASDFEAVELSPLAPLGSCSVVGLASQNKVVSALRGTEVISDPTNVLALECATRLRANPSRPVKLATAHRCVRAQEVPKQPGFAQHFRIFCLATAGLERENHAFVVGALVEHIETMKAALSRLERHGYAFPERTLTVLASPAREALGNRVAAAVAASGRERLEHPYYDGLRYQIGARSTGGTCVPLIDGGVFDWVGKLAANKRLVFVASGMGSQLVPYLFRNVELPAGP